MNRWPRDPIACAASLLAIALCIAPASSQDGDDELPAAPPAFIAMPKSVLAKVEDSVFEVVVDKQEDKFIEYEHPLPLDKIPYQIRNDRFVGLGTAFSIGNNRYVSAAHLFRVGLKTIMTGWGLRDRVGKVHRISRIFRYSNYRDLIEFDLEDTIQKSFPLELTGQAEVGSEVFTAGNVDGEGITYRGGQISSLTPEEVDGKWKFIRFSAPASPGNSGGPLLDSKGRVVGVVSRRNATENLNYAIPIAEYRKLSGSSAEFFQKHIKFRSGKKMVDRDWKASCILPVPLADLRNNAEKSLRALEESLLAELYEGKNESDFPDSPSFRDYLTRQGHGRFFGALRSDGSGGNWKIEFPKMHEVELEPGRHVYLAGSPRLALMAVVEKPQDLTLAQFFAQPGKVMDDILRGSGVSRRIADESIKVLSYGAPKETRWWKDRLGRPWLRSRWYFGERDMLAETDCLVFPGGEACMVTLAPVAAISMAMIDLIEHNVNEIVMTYGGTIDQWRKFLVLGENKIPSFFRGSNVGLQGSGQLTANFEEFKIIYEDESVTPKSKLEVTTGYRPSERIGAKILRVTLQPWQGQKGGLEARILFAPSDRASPEQKDKWGAAKAHSTPYDGEVFPKGDFSHLMTVIGAGAQGRLYIAECWRESNESKDSLIKDCKKFKEGIAIR